MNSKGMTFRMVLFVAGGMMCTRADPDQRPTLLMMITIVIHLQMARLLSYMYTDESSTDGIRTQRAVQLAHPDWLALCRTSILSANANMHMLV